MASSPSASTVAAKPAPAPPSLSVWDQVSFGLAHSLLAVLLTLLSLKSLYRVGRAFGTLEWMINYKRRRRFARALAEVFTEGADRSVRRRATREHFMRTRCDKMFYLIFDRLPRDTALALFSIDNKTLLDEALARGRGVYIALSHHGPHHVSAMLFALHGYKVAGVRDRREGGIRRYVQDRLDRRYPEFQRMRVLFADGFPRAIYRCFEEGYVVGSAIDVSRVRHDKQRYEEVELFGEKRPVLVGPLRIARRCGAPVLQAFLLPDHDFKYRLHIVEALVDPDRSDPIDTTEAVKRYAANVERFIRRNPSLISRV